jgi:hypothetical protein
VVTCEPRRSGFGPRQAAQDGRHGVAQLQDEGGVDDVLAGGAPVDVAGGVGIRCGDVAREVAHERDRQVAGCRRFAGDRRRIVEIRAGGAPDRRCARPRYDAELGFGIGERRLDVEHRLQPRLIRQVGRRLGIAKQRAEQIPTGGARHRRIPSRRRPGS